MSRPPKAPEPRSRGGEAERRWILELLGRARERHETAFPEADSDQLVYFAHLTAIRQLTEAFYKRALRPHQISDSEFRVLSSLRVSGAGYRTTPLELNRSTQITSAGMTRTLDRLERAGYVERLPNPEDRRSILIGLTDLGWSFSETLVRDLGAQYAEVLGDADARALKAETDQMAVIARRLVDAITR